MENTIESICPSFARWQAFFTEWQALERQGNKAQDVTAWSAYFSEFSAIASTLKPKQRTKINVQSAESYFSQFKVLFDDYWRSSEAVSIWQVAGLKSDEVRTCAVLAWLLDRHGSHGQGDAFMRIFLECVHDAAPASCKLLLPAAADLEKGYRSLAEQPYCTAETEDCDSRVDIEITGREFVLFVEAKVYAPEGPGQLERYARILNNKAGNRHRALVFLTVHGNERGDSVVPLCWRELASAFTHYVEQKMNKNAFGSVCIRQFCEHIAKF